jgi:uncharacterized OB-fold protein
MGKQVPIVDYLVLDDGPPHLMQRRCQACGAGYFDRRNACARCGGLGFDRVPVGGDGEIRTFTIVHRAAPNVATPYVSVVVETADGVQVKSNVVGVDPDPDHVRLGMPVRLTTYVAGTDDDGTEAIGFGYEPRKAE